MEKKYSLINHGFNPFNLKKVPLFGKKLPFYLLMVFFISAFQTAFAAGGIGYKGVYINNKGSKTWYKAHNVSWGYNGCGSYMFNGASNFSGQDFGDFETGETLEISGYAVVGWTDNSDWVAGRIGYKVWKDGDSEPAWTYIDVGNYNNLGGGAGNVRCTSGNDRVVGRNDYTIDLNTGTDAGTYNIKIKAFGQMQWSGYAFNVNDGSEVTATFDVIKKPIVTTTDAISNMTGTTADSGGNVTSDEGATVTERGLAYATTTSPVRGDNKVTTAGTTGTFSGTMTGLTPGATYYVRSYAKNSVGTTYGPEISFISGSPPTVAATTAASSIEGTTASTGGNVTADGAVTITERGVVYGTSTNPTTADSKEVSAGTTGSFTSNLTGLTAGTTYYVRAFATNAVSTTYGTEISFTTDTAPTVAATTAASSITGTTASSGGNITADGNGTISERGVVFGTSSNPTTADSKIIDGGTTTGSFTSNLTGLTAGTVYYVRAYAINGVGTSYGTQIIFTTDTAPTVAATTAATSITGTTASSGGNITGDGSGTISERGIVYNTSTTPTTSHTKVVNGATTTGSFTSSLTGLTAGTTYYVRAYATNGVGTTYGTEISFTTDTAPTVAATTVASSITGNTASSGGNITGDGNGTISERGIVYNTSTAPTISHTKVVDGSTTTGSFTSNLIGLTAGTTYYVRAYATNGVGTTYGTEISFTTDTIPVLATTTAASAIGATLATSGGNVTSDGGEAVTERGIVYSTTTTPTTSDTKITATGTTGSFVSNITGLAHSTTYYVRSYAINSVGTAYGAQISFSTLTQTAPSLAATTAASSIEGTTASSGGNVLGTGGDTITERGIVYGTSSTPTISDTKVIDGSTTTGSFSSNLTGLTAGTTYYVRAYATNGIGTTYGTEISFTTDTAPTVAATTAASSIEGTTASSGGNITSDGNGTITERGIVYNTSSTPTTSHTKVVDGSTTTGSFTSNLTGLTAGTTYYVRAYAINGVGTTYGAEVSFTTDVAPSVAATTAASSIEGTTASSGGNITSDGNGTITERGIVYNTSSTPTTAHTKVIDGSTTTGSFTSNLTGLTAGTTYYVRAYAINGVGTTYGAEVSFTTDIAPTVAATTAASSITASTASSGGNITSDGNGVISERGVVFGTSSNPTTSDTKVTSAGTTGVFTSSLTGLTEGTTYYVRAYAINGVGTTYGTEISFTTLAVATTVAATTAASSIEGATATSGGNVTYDGNGTISERGIVFNTSTAPTTAHTKVVDGSTTEGSFTSNMTGLTANTTYYVRAYAINEIGTTYGTEISFTTDTVPAVAATTAASSIEGTTASTGGNITSDGNGTISERGVVYGTSSNPTTADTKSTSAGTTGSFTSNLTGLSINTTYYVRAYATNGVGTTYGTEISFTTDDYPGVAATTAASSIEGTTASSGGNITSDGNGTISERGIVYNTSTTPTTSHTKVVNGSTTTGSFTSNMTGLSPGTTYYVRAYAINGVGTAYGAEISFTTGVAPTVTTTDGGNTFDFQSGNSGGNVTNTGGGTLTERGIVYGTSSNPTTSNTKVIDGATISGAYSSSITGLSEATTYYVRAYAINDAGTSYGTEVSFTTLGKPNNLLANSNSATTVDLSWSQWSSRDVMIVRHTANSFTQPTNGVTYNATDAIGAGTVIYRGNATSMTDTGLSTATTYYYAFYSENFSYYSDKDTTSEQTALPPTVTTDSASATSYYGGSATGDIVSDGGATVTERGFLIHTSTDPTYATATNILKSDDVSGSFTESLDGLVLYSRTYYIRAYAINAAGTSYGISRSITTSSKPSNSEFYADRVYFKNGSSADEKYYLMYNNNGGCTSGESLGTENWNTKNLGTLQSGATAKLGGFTVTDGIQNGNQAKMNYRIYKRYDSKPSFTTIDLDWVSNCNADGDWWHDTFNDKVWRTDLFDITIPSTPGEYAIEVYFWRSGDRSGGGGTKYINNGGQNFTAYITVESNDAADFDTGIISANTSFKLNSDAVKYYQNEDVYYCDPGNEGASNATIELVGTDAVKFGGEILTTDAVTSPVVYYTTYAFGSRPGSPTFSSLNLTLAGTQCTDVTNSYKYENHSSGTMAAIISSGDLDPGIHVIEYYYQATIGGTVYTKTESVDDNYYTYFNVDSNDNVIDSNDGNMNPTCTNCSGIYESYMGLVIKDRDGGLFLNDIFDLDASNGSSNTANFDLGDVNPGISFRIGTEAKIFTKGNHKACGCSSWFYTYKDSEPNAIATDFPLPPDGDLFESHINGKFTIMNSSIDTGRNDIYNTPSHTASMETSTAHVSYNNQLKSGATSTKFQDWTNGPLTINEPINEVVCPTCAGGFNVAVAMLCWVSDDNDCTDESSLYYQRDINRNKVYDYGGTDVYLNPRHPSGPKTDKNTISGTSLFYVSRIDVSGNGVANTYNGTVWSEGHLSESAEDVTMNGDYSTADGSFTCNNLTVADGVTITIRDGEYIEVLNTATTNGSGGSRGKIVVEKGGNFVQRCNEKAASAYIEHAHSTRTLAVLDYAYIGPSIVEDAMDVLPGTFDLKYGWVQGTGWSGVSTTSPGVGFIARNTTEGANAFEFKGTATNGPINIPVTLEDESNATDDNNFALLANPYPCTLDAKLFLEHGLNEHLGTIYIWTSNTRRGEGNDGAVQYGYSEDDYATYNLSGWAKASSSIEGGIGSAAVPTENIYSGQGFFVQVTADGNAHFNNDMRKTSGNSATLFRSALLDLPGRNDGGLAYDDATLAEIAARAEGKIKSRLWLNVTNKAGSFKQMLLAYVPGATVNNDRLFDAPLNSTSKVQLYSLSNGEAFGTQGRPSLMIDDNETIPLGLISDVEDTFEIIIENLEGKFTDKEVYLEDKDLGISHNLKDGPYTFSTTSGTYDERFELRIAAPDQTLSDVDNEIEVSTLIAMSRTNALKVVNSNKEIQSVDVYDLLGKLIQSQFYDETSESVTVNGVAKTNSLVIVNVSYTDGTSETKKVMH